MTLHVPERSPRSPSGAPTVQSVTPQATRNQVTTPEPPSSPLTFPPCTHGSEPLAWSTSTQKDTGFSRPGTTPRQHALNDTAGALKVDLVTSSPLTPAPSSPPRLGHIAPLSPEDPQTPTPLPRHRRGIPVATELLVTPLADSPRSTRNSPLASSYRPYSYFNTPQVKRNSEMRTWRTRNHNTAVFPSNNATHHIHAVLGEAATQNPQEQVPTGLSPPLSKYMYGLIALVAVLALNAILEAVVGPDQVENDFYT